MCCFYLKGVGVLVSFLGYARHCCCLMVVVVDVVGWFGLGLSWIFLFCFVLFCLTGLVWFWFVWVLFFSFFLF